MPFIDCTTEEQLPRATLARNIDRATVKKLHPVITATGLPARAQFRKMEGSSL